MIIFFQIFDGKDRYNLGKVENGEVIEEIQDGFKEWIQFETSLPTTPDFEDEEGLLRAYEGPHIVAQIVER